ncbi:class I SAM-dependent methyltransferase [Methylobacterium longum]|uniref:Methyltransferase domain-containing protein n=1 Tax=Methylobacterium longum TaxID=767694 RepID=A0ABT8AXP8_9HYPH|nr:methyltransferase domain-containing protein [Methylobacterium longum]MDN3574330.1 methyltransferase domain-containing protein [Methylobacterium longum]GJE15208.1 tRNA U34 carboxymethyltransferase [Methylobacterium longum]
MSFTAHNIRLADGTETWPEAGWLIADSPWTKAALRSLRLFYGDRLAGRTIVDLGCLEGGYTVEFARAGMRAVGVEVRRSNYENCLIVRERAGTNGLDFVNDDVWNLADHGTFEAAFCCGLLYHLDKPVEFIRLMSRHVRDVLILHTHFATDRDETMFNLSPLTENEGLPGRWMHEHDLDDTEKLEEHKWTSWSNKRSFWLTKSALIQTLKDCDFNIIYEQYDMLGDDIRTSMESGYYHQHDRSMFVAIRAPA